jgi:pyrimidine-nucleoside phosphorylase
MNPAELIRKKRDGGTLTRDELESFVTAFVHGDIPDYQMSAFLMAAFFRGMDDRETAALTDVMLRSGEIVDLSAIPGIKVDKHSTGGVGDKVSLILAPMVAACGVPVPMISGRGLGHTGGTLDKLESIPGFRTDLSIDTYRTVIAEVGCVLIGQTKDIAPADRRMYALRDVTATVESIPLIAGSIMSKKLAEGIDALVLDIKTGNGAFMKTPEDSVALARALVGIGTAMGKTTVGFITDMSQPLGFAIGNWLEVVESVECLRGKNVPDLMEVTYVLGGAMVHLGGKARSIEEGMQLCRSAIWSGKAYEKFLEIVKRQGGDISVLEQPERYPRALPGKDLLSTTAGYVGSFDTMRIGLLAIELGAGRKKVDDTIEPGAGIHLKRKVGENVGRGEVLATVHARTADALERVMDGLASSIHIVSHVPTPVPLIHSRVDAAGAHPWVTPVQY